MHRRTGLLPFVLLFSPAVGAQDELSWIAGSWCTAAGDQVVEETWLPPRGHETLGVGRTLRGGRMVSFEHMRITATDGPVRFVGQPGGGAPTEFPRTAGGEGWIRFENKAHDFPQRIEYRREGDDGLYAEVAGPGAGGRETVIPFRYRRCGR